MSSRQMLVAAGLLACSIAGADDPKCYTIIIEPCEGLPVRCHDTPCIQTEENEILHCPDGSFENFIADDARAIGRSEVNQGQSGFSVFSGTSVICEWTRECSVFCNNDGDCQSYDGSGGWSAVAELTSFTYSGICEGPWEPPFEEEEDPQP